MTRARGIPGPRVVRVQALPRQNEMDVQEQKDDRAGKNVEIMQSSHTSIPARARIAPAVCFPICLASSNPLGSIADALDQPLGFFTCEDRPKFGDFGTRFFRAFGPE